MTVDKIKNEGNVYFKKKEYNKAVECYTEAIDLDVAALCNNTTGVDVPVKTRLSTLYRNKAMALFKMNDFKNSLATVNSSLENEPDNLKSLNWKSKILYKLRKYNECEQVIKLMFSLLNQSKDNNNAILNKSNNNNNNVSTKDKIELEHLLNCVKHCKMGFNVEKVLSNTEIDFVNCYAHLQHQSDKVEILKSARGNKEEGKIGFKVIAKEDVPAGELIYAGHPIVSISGEKTKLDDLGAEMQNIAKGDKEFAKKLANHCNNNNSNNMSEHCDIGIKEYLSLCEKKSFFFPLNLSSTSISDFICYEDDINDDHHLHDLRAFYDFP
eukprot:Pgem_evm2s6146